MEIISRAQWGAIYGRGTALDGPLGENVIHTSAGRVGVQPAADEAAHWRGIERYHVEVNGWSGIGYSFGTFPSGRIYEGRGWLRSGAHTEGRNWIAHGLCMIGHGDYDPATEAQWASNRWLIGEGIRVRAVRPDPLISGHRDYSTKSCPGDLIYPHLGRLRGITGPITEGDMTTEEHAALMYIKSGIQQLVVFGTTSIDATIESLFGHLRRIETNSKAALDQDSAILGALTLIPTSSMTDEQVSALADRLAQRLPSLTPEMILDALTTRLAS